MVRLRTSLWTSRRRGRAGWLGVMAVAAGTVGVVGVVAAQVARRSSVVTRPSIAGAARTLIEAAPEAGRAKLRADFSAKGRTEWLFVPADRPGLSLGEMTDAQRVAARDLLRAGLSSQGILKVEAVVALESVLRDLEKGNSWRDPARYVFMIYGEPGDPHGWAWKFEGHHISVNFTLLGDEVVGSTPLFLGANPASVRSGLNAGKKVLAMEEELGRSLLKSLTDDQRKTAVILEEAPSDILTMPGRPLDGMWPDPPVGLSLAAMDEGQKGLCMTLIAEYARNLRGDLADREFARIKAEAPESVRFCWAGPAEPGRGHYYRIVGRFFAIEYDNTQNEANHVHTVWHDRERNFGQDPLRDHLKSR